MSKTTERITLAVEAAKGRYRELSEQPEEGLETAERSSWSSAQSF